MSGVWGGLFGWARSRMQFRSQSVDEVRVWHPTPPKVACNSRELVLCDARKRWNCNDAISMCERLTGELHAKLLWFVAVAVAVAVRVPVTPHAGPMTCTWALSSAR